MFDSACGHVFPNVGLLMRVSGWIRERLCQCVLVAGGQWVSQTSAAEVHQSRGDLTRVSERAVRSGGDVSGRRQLAGGPLFRSRHGRVKTGD